MSLVYTMKNKKRELIIIQPIQNTFQQTFIGHLLYAQQSAHHWGHEGKRVTAHALEVHGL